MGTKTTYRATFADGTTITRKSEREYTVAWRATWTTKYGDAYARTGFAVSQDRASPERPWSGIHSRMSSNARAAAKREYAEFLKNSGYRVEFVPAVSV